MIDRVDKLEGIEKDEISNENFEVSYSTIKNSIEEHLVVLGYDLNDEGLIGTPDRVTRLLLTELYNREKDLTQVLLTTFDEEDKEGTDDLVAMSDINFSSWCEHHMLPFWGKAYIAYIPNGKIVGISKLVRLVREAARGLNIQERITHDVAEALNEHLKAKGVLVVTRASHSCMIARGVKGFSEMLSVSVVKGVMKESLALRSEALSLLGL